ncbi:hypothetical protein LTR10_021078 [Elasticomyces elasticus]|nr:hypothetical protein LTR10_021078 [Elasticomyces elasticus]
MGNQYQDFVSNKIWMGACLNRPEAFPIAALALKALAVCFFGRQHHQLKVINDSAVLYGRCLRDLTQSLQHLPEDGSFDAAAAVSALYLYEYMSFTTPHSWLQHANALPRLIQMRGADAYATYPDRALLEATRESMTATAWARRQRDFLAEDPWTRVLDEYPTTDGAQMTALHALQARLPGIAESVQKLDLEVEDFQARFQVALDDIHRLKSDLRAWYSAWVSEPNHVPKVVMPRDTISTPPSRQRELFGTILDFDNLRSAKGYLFYCMINIGVLEWEHILLHPNWERGDLHEEMDDIPEAEESAISICRSIEYFLKPAHAEAAPFYLPLPIRVAYLALPKTSRQSIWLLHVVDMLALAHQVEFPRNVLKNIPIRKRIHR